MRTTPEYVKADTLGSLNQVLVLIGLAPVTREEFDGMGRFAAQFAQDPIEARR